VAQRADEMPPIIGDDHSRAGRAGDFSDMRIVDASSGDRVLRGLGGQMLE
jgi:hypothetical protein